METGGPPRALDPKVLLKGEERLDDLQRSGLRIIQDPSGNRFSTDAVLLSSFCKAKGNDRVADLGTGTGILPLLIWAKWNPAEISGIELDEATADMAMRSVALNGLEKNIRIISGDLKNAPAVLGKARFTLVVSNPPYIRGGSGVKGESRTRAMARHEISCTFDDVAKAASSLLVPKGRFCLVHRPDRLTDLMCSLRANGLEPKELRTVHTKASDPPVLILLSAVKGALKGLKAGAPLVIYGRQGEYTEETASIYFG